MRMKHFLIASILFSLLLIFLITQEKLIKISKAPLAQEKTIEDFKRLSTENLKKYPLAQLTHLDPIKDKETLKNLSLSIQSSPEKYLFLTSLTSLSLIEGLTSLDKEVAQALASWKGVYLYLDGLTSLDKEVAQFLASWIGRSLF